MIEDWVIEIDEKAIAAAPGHLKFVVGSLEAYSTPFIPSLVGEEQWLVCAYCPASSAGYASAHHTERLLYPPQAVERIHYPSGEFEWLEPAASAYGGPALQLNEAGVGYLGPISRDHLGPDAWSTAADNYFPLVCRVVEQRWLVTAYPTTDEERAAARELQRCVRALYDAPLLPYYQQVGYHFLAWMERAAK